MKETLELAGLPAQVTSVSAAEEVLYAAEDDTLDIALLNLELPDVDATIVDELRSLDGAKRLPIIAFSDEPPEHADHVFPKPEHEAEYMGIVAAIRFYWMSAAPSLPPPAPPSPKLLDIGPDPETTIDGGSVCPRPMPDVDLMGLPIEPVEAYLLSMVDGTMGVDEISLSIGAEVKETRAMLRRLAGLGVVAWRAPHPSMAPPPPPSVAPIVMDSGFRKPMVPISDSVGAQKAEPAAQLIEVEDEEPQEIAPPQLEALEPENDLPAEPAESKDSELKVFADDARKKSIDDAHALLGEADYYELLGVPRNAEKKDIRKAYFTLAKLFHTDSLYGVELEEYGPKMDKVFQAITEAYEVLGKKKKRRAYDAYLGAVNETATLEAPRHSNPPPRPSVVPKALVIPRVSVVPEASLVTEPSAEPAALETTSTSASAIPSAIPKASIAPIAEAPIAEAPVVEAPVAETPVAEAPVAEARVAEARVAEAPATSPEPARRPEPTRTRRDIAKKLLARRTGRHARPPEAPQVNGAAAEPARSRPKDRADRLIDDARIAEEKGNITGAAEALRIASAWRPHDRELAKDAERLRQAALIEKAPAFAKRARYAERNGNWEEAATCWSRVADVRLDDHGAARGAAAAIVKSCGDVRVAADYAKRAVQLAPRDSECHRVLGEVWIAAGMPASAKRCLETALKLSPKDEKSRVLLEGLQS